MPIVRKETPKAAAYAAEVMEDEDDVFQKEDENEQADFSASLQAGWEVADKKMSESSGNWTQELRVEENEPSLVAFIDGAPIDTFEQHFHGRVYRCLGDRDVCPLCRAGLDRRRLTMFYVLEFVFADDGKTIEPIPKIWKAGARVFDSLKSINASPRKGGPLEGKFFAVHRTGSGLSTQYSILPVKARDLEDDWGIPEDAAMAEIEKIRSEQPLPKVYVSSLSDLEEAASDIRKGSSE